MFLSFVRGLHFLLCNKRPVCRKTDWVFISSSFFLKKQFRKFEKQVRYLFLPHILSVTRPVIPTVEFLYFGHALHWPTYLHYVLLSYMIVLFQRNNSESFLSPIHICFYLISSLLLPLIPIIEFKRKIYFSLSGTASKCSGITVNLLSPFSPSQSASTILVYPVGLIFC